MTKKVMLTVMCSNSEANKLCKTIHEVTGEQVVYAHECDHAHIVCQMIGVDEIEDYEDALKFLSKENEPTVIGS